MKFTKSNTKTNFDVPEISEIDGSKTDDQANDDIKVRMLYNINYIFFFSTIKFNLNEY